MHGSNEKWQRVSRLHPCPICGRPDWCLISLDGTAAICGRTSDGAIKYIDGSGFLHRIDPDRVVPLPPVTAVSDDSEKPDFIALLRQHREHAEPRLQDLARTLGVSADALRNLKVGFDNRKQQFLFPERDGQGTIVGILTRDQYSQKKRLKGSKNGLSYADAWDSGEGPVILVEGPTDTAALLTLGLNAIGRPSNRGGVVFLAELLHDFPEDREIIVLGDDDQKEDGLWPGKDGAVQTAKDLATRLERTVCWAITPDHAKDAREWLSRYVTSEPLKMQQCFLDGLHPKKITPPPTVRVPQLRVPDTLLGDYRDEMVMARLRGIDQPGFYLDRSMTGTGKSTVDLEVVKVLIKLAGGAA
ncbi:toprim domain-containing protein [Rubinisphaera margarita]|uniref:toprim domain-containing protein n=1 Tax=Rubinisphaera margarita TaxID=2909586 RepID=UPI001EE8C23B|nr:hypothetical protein [Rubinisphaera margarita]MCG6158332.1 hypothetical protein [Rubinisphaera margarita]